MQLLLNPDAIEHTRQRTRDQTHHHSRESHLRFANPVVAASQKVGDPVGEGAGCEDTEDTPDDSGEETETGLPGEEIVGVGEREGEVGCYGYDEADGH